MFIHFLWQMIPEAIVVKVYADSNWISTAHTI